MPDETRKSSGDEIAKRDLMMYARFAYLTTTFPFIWLP